MHFLISFSCRKELEVCSSHSREENLKWYSFFVVCLFFNLSIKLQGNCEICKTSKVLVGDERMLSGAENFVTSLGASPITAVLLG